MPVLIEARTAIQAMQCQNFLDARYIESGTKLDCDLCVVGAGAAGITIAREFSATGLRICLLESGGLDVDESVNRLSEIDDVGRLAGKEGLNRRRCFGGTTNLWGGHCTPLEPDDFQKHDWIPHSGWPYDYSELHPYYIRAHNVLELGEFNYDAARISSALGVSTFPFDKTLVATTVSRYNALRFGNRYGDELDRAKNIKVILYSEASEILMADSAASKVTDLLVKSVAGNRFHVGAKYYIIACGGVENARLLLMSNGQRPLGIGNHSDLVGRFFQEHLWYSSGYIVPSTGAPDLTFYLQESRYRDVNVRAHLAVPSDKARELKIPKFRSEIVCESVSLPFRLAKKIKHRISAGDVFALMSDPVGLGALLRCQTKIAPLGYQLMNHVEQTPNPYSRVTLFGKKDPLGRRQPRLNWAVSPLDQEGLVRAQRLIAHEVGRSGFGRMRVELREGDDDFLKSAVGTGHHIGTTRMDDNPARGVTNGDAKVHHTTNLYIAGSSLFPRCGWSNPTLTIVATSIRLSDHLKTRFRADGMA